MRQMEGDLGSYNRIETDTRRATRISKSSIETRKLPGKLRKSISSQWTVIWDKVLTVRLPIDRNCPILPLLLPWCWAVIIDGHTQMPPVTSLTQRSKKVNALQLLSEENFVFL